jgi:uncharacterized protein DUF6600/FecR-like protein
MPTARTRSAISAVGLALSLGLVHPQALYAQPGDSSAPAHFSVVDGVATLEREQGSEPATVGVPFVPGDRITTDAGRVEILFSDGSALAVDEYSVLDLQSDGLLRLVSGRAILTVTGSANPATARRYQIDTPVASVANAGPGEFRVTVLPGRTELEAELAVLRGAATLTTEVGSMLVRAGERSLAADRTPPSDPQSFNSARFDEFDRWAAARRSGRLGPALSGQYLPSELRPYGGTFDRNGSWNYEAPYGYVWYPTVTAAWRPYYHGYWRSLPRWGWTWIGLDVWGWPTHHYGRWGYARSRWFWVPDRHYGPGWVSWATAPGYVSWCPLGFDNRPVFALSVSAGNPWLGWAVLPRRHFGLYNASYVSSYTVARQLPTSRSFVVHAAPPIAPARAIPRPGSSQSASGPVAVPRAGFTRSASRGTAVLPQTGPGDAAADSAISSRGRADGVTGAPGSRARSRPASVPEPVFKDPLPTPSPSAQDPAAGARALPRAGYNSSTNTTRDAEPQGGDPRATPRDPGWSTWSTRSGDTAISGARRRSSSGQDGVAGSDAQAPPPPPEQSRVSPRAFSAGERPAPANRESAAPPANRESAAPPANRESAAPPAERGGTRAAPRSAPAQASSPAAAPRQGGESRGGPPAGARSRSR